MNRRDFIKSIAQLLGALGLAGIAGLPEVEEKSEKPKRIIGKDVYIEFDNGQTLHTPRDGDISPLAADEEVTFTISYMDV